LRTDIAGLLKSLAKLLAIVRTSDYTSDVHGTLVILSALLGAYSPIRYIQDILKGRCTPHRVTRFVLCVSLLLTFCSTWAAHGNMLAILLTGMYATCGGYAFWLSIHRGVGGTSEADILCLVAALAGLSGWALSGDPVVGLVCSIVADIMAYIPTVRQTWAKPNGEAHWTYTFSAIAAGISLVAYPFTTGSWFTAYLVGIGVVMVACIKRPRIQYAWQRLRPKRV